MEKSKIKVSVISDVVCPWCYIGKQRLEKAIESLEEKFDFEIQYLPFELNPNIPKEGFDQKEYLINKFGGEIRYKEVTDHVTKIATEEGLNFNFSLQAKSPNTLDAHRIIWLAQKEEKQKEVAEAFFKAYFEKGIDLTQTENLISISKEAGLDEVMVRNFLGSEEAINEVRIQEELNQKLGVTGVPFYIINDKYGISGAQPSEVLVKAFLDICNEPPSEGQSCDLEGNC